jgi:hypothetical protein
MATKNDNPYDMDEATFEGFVNQADLLGISFATVKDGKVMLLKKDFLKRLLAHINKKGSDQAIIFIQDQEAAKKKGS